jgi:signal transduction histidine kinase
MNPMTVLAYQAPERAEYDSGLNMTLKRLRVIAVVVPMIGVLVLEAVRYVTVGLVSWEKRIVLDLVFIAAIVLFSAIIFRYFEEIQETLRRKNLELLALHDAGLDVSSDLSLDAVLKRVVDQARILVGARYGALSVVDQNQRIVSFITAGISKEESDAIGPPPVGHGLLGVVLREGQHLRLTDLNRDPRSQGFPPNHPPMHSLLAVPVPCQGPFLGNLYLTEKEAGGVFTDDDEQTLVRFARQAAHAIDNAHLHQQVASFAVAEERIRIAHEMHDGLAQVLGYVNTKVQAAGGFFKRGATDEAEQQLNELAAAARQAYADVRESIVGLRALPGERSFSEVLADYVRAWEEMTSTRAVLSIEPGLQLLALQELQIVRIIQEALTNVRKHARASSVSIAIRRDVSVLLVAIEDDGIGFDPGARSRGELPRFGLTTMRERAESIGGTLKVESEPGKGTRVRFELPMLSAQA